MKVYLLYPIVLGTHEIVLKQRRRVSETVGNIGETVTDSIVR